MAEEERPPVEEVITDYGYAEDSGLPPAEGGDEHEQQPQQQHQQQQHDGEGDQQRPPPRRLRAADTACCDKCRKETSRGGRACRCQVNTHRSRLSARGTGRLRRSKCGALRLAPC